MTETGILTDASPWISVEPAAWRPLTEGRTPRLFRKKTFLYTQGQPAEHFYIIQRGRACISTSRADGHEKQLYIAERAPCAGRAPVCSGSPTRRRPWRLWTPGPMPSPAGHAGGAAGGLGAESAVPGALLSENTVLLGQVRELSFDQAERRIARPSSIWRPSMGGPCPEGVRISIRFTHQDVAGIINTSRITTNKVMKRMEEEGILLKREGRYILRALPALGGWRGERVSSAQPFRSPGRRGCLAGGCARSRRRWRR